MATVKIKLRPSSVEGKAGVIFYQITHNRKTQHITTRLRVQPFDWNADKEKLEPSAPNRSMIQNCIDCDVALLRSLISNLDTCRMNYSVNDIISRYKSPQNHILVLEVGSINSIFYFLHKAAEPFNCLEQDNLA